MKRRNFLVTTLLGAALTVSVAACNSNAPADTSTGTGGEGDRTLVMATSADYPPYEFVDSASGSQEIQGFDVDIARYITEELGYELEIQNVDFNGLIPALQANRADFVMAGMTPTDERKQNADFSDIYYEARNTIVTTQNSGLNTIDSLRGKKVGVQLGSTQEQAAKEQVQGATIVSLNRINEMIQELKAGRVDAVIMEDTVAQGYVNSNPDLAFNTIANTGEAGSAIAFPKGSPLVSEFNTVLAQMEQEGKLEELVNKWFGDESPAANQQPES